MASLIGSEDCLQSSLSMFLLLEGSFILSSVLIATITSRAFLLILVCLVTVLKAIIEAAMYFMCINVKKKTETSYIQVVSCRSSEGSINALFLSTSVGGG